ncbi:hypothetical protein C6499_00505 [Candidatus Poribacteria bacterium]|nr:MAG: hypothetical protein C6499_00505 [Candidatus Poribacteria bacterium]
MTSIIKVAEKKFKLASRWARLGAFLLDVGFLGLCQALLIFSGFALFTIFDGFNIRDPSDMTTVSVGTLSVILWGFGLFFMDGFKRGGGFGKRLLSLQIIRLEDGKPANFKDAFVRRFAGIFQPVDWLFATGKERQRMGDKLAKTVVVKLDSKSVEFVTEDGTESKVKAGTETTDLEKVLGDVIREITNRFSEAKQKVDASIGVEKQFQNAHEGAIAQAERCEERAIIAIQAGREDLAREDLAQRNEYHQLASSYKAQWEEQRQVVSHLTTLFETLQQKTQETERKRDQVIAQHTNVDAHEHLRQALTEFQDSKAFEILRRVEENVTEATALAKAAAEVDVEFKDVKLNREFAGYAEDASIDKDLAELKARLQ